MSKSGEQHPSKQQGSGQDLSESRILISRLSAIGDCILTAPLLCALRDNFPGAHITWVVERAAASLLTGHPCLDELIVVPKRWMKSLREVRSLRKKLRQRRFDIALDPQSLTKSAVVSWLSNAPRRIGFTAPRGRELSLWLNNEFVEATNTHTMAAHLDLLRPLGVEVTTGASDIEYRLPSDEVAERSIGTFVDRSHFGCDFAAINVGAGWDSRLWPAERYGRVAKHLGQQHNIPSVVVWAGDREREFAETVVERSGGHAILAPPTTLPELAVVLRRASFYLGSDTGPLHISQGNGTPCVVLHGTTRPEDSGAYGPQHISIQARYQSGTSRQRRSAANDAMREIDVETVCDACDQMLSRLTDDSVRAEAA